MAFNSSTISVGSTTKKSHFDQLLDNTIALNVGYATMPPKTFYSSTVFKAPTTFSSTVSFQKTSTIAIDHIGASGTSTIVQHVNKKIDLRPWDMNNDSTEFYNVGIPYTQWRNVTVLIKADSGTTGFVLHDILVGGDWKHDTVQGSDALRISRTASGQFDSGDYEQTGTYSRGWIMLEYEE